MAGRKVPTLLDIAQQEGFQVPEASSPKPEVVKPKREKKISEIGKKQLLEKKHEGRNPKPDGGNRKGEKGRGGGTPQPVPKSEYLKVTTTMEPGMVELLDRESWSRRMAKADFSYSAIVRDALDLYFKGRTNYAQGGKR